MKLKIIILSSIIFASLNCFAIAATQTPGSGPTITATVTATVTAMPTACDVKDGSGGCTVTPQPTATAIPTVTVSTDSTPSSNPACSNQIDDDHDGLIDSEDPDCKGSNGQYDPNDSSENGNAIITSVAPQCSDGIDNDGDGLTDVGQDTDCSSSSDNSESPLGSTHGIQCVNVFTESATFNLNEEAVQLTKIAKKAVARLNKTAGNQKLKTQAAGSLKKVNATSAIVFETLLGVPKVATVCPGVVCKEINNFEKIKLLKELQNTLRGYAKRIIARTFFNQLGSTQRKDPLVMLAKKVQVKGKLGLDQLDAIQKACAGS